MNIWYTARGAGLSALILLSISTCLGALMSRSAPVARGGVLAAERRYVLQYVHRVCAGLGLAVLTLHIVMILMDSYAHVGVIGAIVPFTSGYRPGWIALGTFAVYGVVAGAAVGVARTRMASTPRGAKAWRIVHCLAYASWVSAILHGFMSGTDSALGWVRLLYVACLAAVATCSGIRLLQLRPAGASRFVEAPARASRVTDSGLAQR